MPISGKPEIGAVALRSSPGRKRPGERLRVTDMSHSLPPLLNRNICATRAVDLDQCGSAARLDIGGTPNPAIGVAAMNLRSLIPIGRSRDVARREYSPFWSLQQEIDRLFDDFTRGFPTFSTAAARGQELLPAMDVTETNNEIELTAELPGLEEKDVQINLADNVLTIRGEKKSERDEKTKDYRVVERSYGSFYRTLELPPG